MPLFVVYGRAAPAISEEFARVSAAIRHGESLPRLLGGVSLARRLRVSSLRASPSSPVAHRRWSVPRSYQVSVTSGTFVHNTKTPLTVWFWAAYLAVTDKRGLSALLLQRQLGLTRYETAWMLLHKLRRAMVNAAREPLHDDVEMDDTWVGGPQPGLRGSRQLKGRKAALVLVAVEKRGDVSGRVRMAALLDLKEATVHAFVKQPSRPARRSTPMRKSSGRSSATGVRHLSRLPSARMEFRRGAVSVVPLADRAIGNLQQSLIGTGHGVSRAKRRFISTSSCFDTTAAGSRWRRFRRCSGWAAVARPHRIAGFRGARDLIER